MKGQRCRACRHGKPGCKGKSYRSRGCVGPKTKAKAPVKA